MMQFRLLGAAAIGLVMASLAGCGGGDYQERLEARAGELRASGGATAGGAAGAAAAQLYAPAPVGGTPVKVQIPQHFASAVADPQQMAIPKLTIPGQAMTYQGQVADAAGGQLPYYLYVGALSAAEAATLTGGAGQFTNTSPLYQSLQTAYGGGVGAIETVQAGGKPWFRVRATAEMEFWYVQAGGQGAMSTLPGTLELWLHEENGWLAWHAWRMPTSIETHSRVAELAPVVAATMTFQ